jgi:hypothetical protein
LILPRPKIQYMILHGGKNGCPAVKLRENGPNTRNCVTRGHLKPPRPHPVGQFPHPQAHVGEAVLWVRARQRAYMALGMGGQNGCLAIVCAIFLPWPLPGVSTPPFPTNLP